MSDESNGSPAQPEPQPTALAPRPVLDYRGVEMDRSSLPAPPRKPLPVPFCIGFFASAMILACGGLATVPEWRHQARQALALVLAVAVAGAALAAWPRTRTYATGFFLALGIWLLLFGVCAGLGGV